MIAKLAGLRGDGRGTSFKTLFAYVFHDKNRARTSRRLAWAEPFNCALSGSIRDAWYEMFLTWHHRATLKRAAGIATTGRDNERPALHLSLSWHPSETPSRDEMLKAARDALEWLDLDEHQAVVAAHNDEPQPHVHVVVNTVHPVTGKTCSLYQSKKALSAWAAHWEEIHGGIVVPGRRRAPKPQSACATFSTAAERSKPAVQVTNDNSRHRMIHAFNRLASRIVTPLLVLFGAARLRPADDRKHFPSRDRQPQDRRSHPPPRMRL